MRRKSFTLVELLVVIGIIAVLMGILLPALNAVRRSAQKVVCGTNLAGIGKAILLYANDYGGDYPRAGSSGSRWATSGEISDWRSLDGTQYGMTPHLVTITSSLFLLVKYADVTPEQFVCRGDAGTKVFKLSDATITLPTTIDDITDVWDFGKKTETQMWPGQRNSYSYHDPYATTTASAFPLGSYSNPASPVCADRNPYLDKNAKGVYLEGSSCGGVATEKKPFWEAAPAPPHYADPDKTGNAAAHQREGQNVLFNDTHINFEKYPNIGISRDNIWKFWPNRVKPTTDKDRELGLPDPFCASLATDGPTTAVPGAEFDAFLVSERNNR